jgi:PIN domain nuclease of toxin-antitoxin system
VRLLLDTQIVLWALTGSTRLGKAARELIADPRQRHPCQHRVDLGSRN